METTTKRENTSRGMINLWKYGYGGKVKIINIVGETFTGMAREVTDMEERSDEERQENGITIECDGALIEFFKSEIKSIVKI